MDSKNPLGFRACGLGFRVSWISLELWHYTMLGSCRIFLFTTEVTASGFPSLNEGLGILGLLEKEAVSETTVPVLTLS